jgi:hypothetical protein
MHAPPNPLYFLIAFPLLWFVVTMILSFLSGWFGLMERYPDHDETPVVTLTNQSGSMGLVSMRGVLKLSVCPSGLRCSQRSPIGWRARPVIIGRSMDFSLKKLEAKAFRESPGSGWQ